MLLWTQPNMPTSELLYWISSRKGVYQSRRLWRNCHLLGEVCGDTEDGGEISQVKSIWMNHKSQVNWNVVEEEGGNVHVNKLIFEYISADLLFHAKHLNRNVM